jgi:hypothetical protein
MSSSTRGNKKDDILFVGDVSFLNIIPMLCRDSSPEHPMIMQPYVNRRIVNVQEIYRVQKDSHLVNKMSSTPSLSKTTVDKTVFDMLHLVVYAVRPGNPSDEQPHRRLVSVIDPMKYSSELVCTEVSISDADCIPISGNTSGKSSILKDFLFHLLRLPLIKKHDYQELVQKYDAKTRRDLIRMTIQELYHDVEEIFKRLNVHIAMVEGNHRLFAAAIAHRQLLEGDNFVDFSDYDYLTTKIQCQVSLYRDQSDFLSSMKKYSELHILKRNIYFELTLWDDFRSSSLPVFTPQPKNSRPTKDSLSPIEHIIEFIVQSSKIVGLQITTSEFLRATCTKETINDSFTAFAEYENKITEVTSDGFKKRINKFKSWVPQSPTSVRFFLTIRVWMTLFELMPFLIYDHDMGSPTQFAEMLQNNFTVEQRHIFKLFNVWFFCISHLYQTPCCFENDMIIPSKVGKKANKISKEMLLRFTLKFILSDWFRHLAGVFPSHVSTWNERHGDILSYFKILHKPIWGIIEVNDHYLTVSFAAYTIYYMLNDKKSLPVSKEIEGAFNTVVASRVVAFQEDPDTIVEWLREESEIRALEKPEATVVNPKTVPGVSCSSPNNWPSDTIESLTYFPEPCCC